MRHRLPRRAMVPLIAGGAMLGALATPGAAAQDDLLLVSRASDTVLPPEPGAPADSGSSSPAISAGGRSVAFVSRANNLASDDDDNGENLFVRRPSIVGRAVATTLASRAPSGVAADDSSSAPAISADGRFVAFYSPADNLSDDDVDNGLPDVFVRDLGAGTTTLVSRASASSGGTASNGVSYSPSISADGRFVAFESRATNLSSADSDAASDVFVRDLALGTTTLVSPASAFGASYSPSISGDGRLVAFTSDTSTTTTAVFVRDRLAQTAELVSRSSAGSPADGSAGDAAISADGRRVAFSSVARNLSDDDVDGFYDVFAHDLGAGTTALVSRAGASAGGAGGDRASYSPSISADGRFVAFESDADNLSGADADGFGRLDVFVRDLATGATTLASRAAGPDGAGGDGSSTEPALSPDGRFVAFASQATNIFDGDGDGFGDIFVRDLGPPAPAAGGPSGAGAAGSGAAGRRVGGLGTPGSARCARRRATIVGTAARNVIRGTARADVIASLGGNDLVRGRGGRDLICLGRGHDRAEGGLGADRILGGPGADRLLGGRGTDRLLGGPGRDLALGGPGRDGCSDARLLSCERSRE